MYYGFVVGAPSLAPEGGRLREAMTETFAAAQKLLGDLEYAIMEVVWRSQRVTVREVAAELTQRHPLAYTTVMTVMSRLAEKGILRQHRVGRAYEYEAAFTPEELTAEAAGRMIRSLLQDFGSLALVEFVHQVGQVDPEQLQRLAELAQEAVEDDAL